MASSVRELLADSVDAVQSGEIAEIVDLYHPNAALYGPSTDHIVGREAIAEHFTTALAQQPEGIEHEVTEEHLHQVTPDLAIVDTVGTSRSSEGGGVEGFTMIAVRDEAGEWLWAGIRGALVAK